MSMAPLQVVHLGHDIDEANWIISIHVASMYLPSLVSGILVDRIGRKNTAICAGLILITAGILAATATGETLIQLTIALVLLGVGWNLGLVSGTTLLVDFVAIGKRARFQGIADVFISISTSIASFFAGIIFTVSSYAVLSYIGVAISAAMIVYILLVNRGKCALN